MKNDGGHAFPVVGMQQIGNQGVLGVFECGMSLRDYFAAAAIAGCMELVARVKESGGLNVANKIPVMAYEIADAMLAERMK